MYNFIRHQQNFQIIYFFLYLNSLSDKKQLQFQSTLKFSRHKNRFYLSKSGDHILFAFYLSVAFGTQEAGVEQTQRPQH